MFGGLTTTSSRIALAAALGLTLGGVALKATPAKAADLGGDCCADLEERVAELEATTVRKGNKKVSVTLSGWVVKSMNFWDDGHNDHFVVGDKDYDLGSRFAITGSASIAPGWSGGFNVTVNTQATTFGTVSNQLDDLGALTGADDIVDTLTGFGNNYGAIATLYSFIYIKSDRWGTLNWGHLSPASDNPAVLADISGTVIETNAVWFEGPSFRLVPKGQGNLANGISGVAWGDLLRCQGLGAGIGTDCWGVAQPAVRYNSPTWGGFRFETSYGKNQLTGPLVTTAGGQGLGPILTANNNDQGEFDFLNASDTDFWDIAGFYTADWNSIKFSAAAAYTWIETAVRPTIAGSALGPSRSVLDPAGDGFDDFVTQQLAAGTVTDGSLFQVGSSILHKPSGFGIYGLYQREETGGENIIQTAGPNLTGIGTDDFRFERISNPDTTAWYIKPFWRKVWGSMNGVGLGSLGATTLYGEFGQYEDQFGAAEINFCAAGFGPDTNVGNFCGTHTGGVDFAQAYVTGSTVERWGLGVVQEIDAAAMHVWARWQHQDVNDISLVGFETDPNGECFDGCRIHQSFDDWDLFQIGGVIFF